jgi:hypothetical protein
LVNVSQTHFRGYMLRSTILDRVDSITDLRVVMDNRMSFYRYVTVGKALAMLNFVKRFQVSAEILILLGPSCVAAF